MTFLNVLVDEDSSDDFDQPRARGGAVDRVAHGIPARLRVGFGASFGVGQGSILRKSMTHGRAAYLTALPLTCLDLLQTMRPAVILQASREEWLWRKR